MNKNPFKSGDVVYLRIDSKTPMVVIRTHGETEVECVATFGRFHINDVSFTPFPKPAIPQPNHVRPIQNGYYLFRFDLGIIFGRQMFKHTLGMVDKEGIHRICEFPENKVIDESEIYDKKFLSENLFKYFN